MIDLRDKAVLLTGASSGIGWATALELAKHKPRLALAARREPELKKLAALTEKAGCETFVLPCDVSDLAQGSKAVESVVQRWGGVDILINNAGRTSSVRFHEQDFDDVAAITQTNYVAAASLIRAVLPGMVERRFGHVVNVASIAGLVGIPYMAAYCASKFAMVGLTEALRREYYGSGVTFTAFCPGTVDTPMVAESLADPKLRLVIRAKTAGQAAAKIVDACRRRKAEVVYGDAPGAVFKALKFAPAASDWLAHQIVRRVHPLGRDGKN
jgi:uncharacterized protein